MKQRLVLKGNSMRPWFHPGDILVIRSISPQAVKKLQIIAFESKGCKELVTHRVLKVVKRNGQLAFLTRGDGCKVTDPLVMEGVLRGKVVGKVKNGQLKDMTRTKEVISYYSSRIYWILRRLARNPFYAMVNRLFPFLPINFILLKSSYGLIIKASLSKKVIAWRMVRGERDITWCHPLISQARRRELEIQLRECYGRRNE